VPIIGDTLLEGTIAKDKDFGMGYRYPELYPGCTGCAACSYVCPDFVFEVFRFDEPVLTEVPA